jgi:hypothetical protein
MPRNNIHANLPITHIFDYFPPLGIPDHLFQLQSTAIVESASGHARRVEAREVAVEPPLHSLRLNGGVRNGMRVLSTTLLFTRYRPQMRACFYCLIVAVAWLGKRVPAAGAG